MTDLVADLPEAMVTALGYDTIGTASGWVTGTVYGLLGPLLLVIFAIGRGAKLIAGEEELGTLELEATSPVSRTRILYERYLVLVVSVVGLVLVVTITCLAFITVLDMDITVGRLLAGSAGLTLLVLAFGSISFAIGASTGRSGVAVGASAALAIAAFMLDAIGPIVEVDWMSQVSPFYWYLGQDPLAAGFDWPGLAKLATAVVCAAAGAIAIFPSRDLRV